MKETILNEGITSELVIASIDRGDSALYQCITSNAYGKDETTIKVVVQGTVMHKMRNSIAYPEFTFPFTYILYAMNNHKKLSL